VTESEPLTPIQRSELLRVLASRTDVIERVDLYGSRARGTHRPGSDVDLILVGDIDDVALTALEIAIEGSDLSLTVDLKRECDLADPAFRSHVLQESRTLFSHDDLAAARAHRERDAAEHRS
jgi:predicted nucleotidyltransferase